MKLLIPNTTQVPNVLLDVVMPAIKNASLRVLLAVARKTYGYQKVADDISLTQLQKLTGLSRQGVVNGIAGLGNLLGIESGDDGMNRYRLNVDLSSGELVNLFDQSKKLTSQKRSPEGSQRGRHTKLNKNKTNSAGYPAAPDSEGTRARAATSLPDELKPAVACVVARINELAGTAYKPDSKIIHSGLVPRLKAGATEAECLAVVDNQWHEWRDKPDMRQYFNPETLFRESKFEKYLNAARMARRNGNAGGFVA
jgi:uncharacterized phage protein (TIGR02220 family)